MPSKTFDGVLVLRVTKLSVETDWDEVLTRIRAAIASFNSTHTMQLRLENGTLNRYDVD